MLNFQAHQAGRSGSWEIGTDLITMCPKTGTAAEFREGRSAAISNSHPETAGEMPGAALPLRHARISGDTGDEEFHSPDMVAEKSIAADVRLAAFSTLGYRLCSAR